MSVCAKFQLSSMSRSGWKIWGCDVMWNMWLRGVALSWVELSKVELGFDNNLGLGCQENGQGLPGKFANVAWEMCKGCRGNVVTCENKVNSLTVQLKISSAERSLTNVHKTWAWLSSAPAYFSLFFPPSSIFLVAEQLYKHRCVSVCLLSQILLWSHWSVLTNKSQSEWGENIK